MFSKDSLDNSEGNGGSSKPENSEDRVQDPESNLQPIDPSLLSADNVSVGSAPANSIDLDAILAANTSQLLAMAAGAAEETSEPSDPFWPSSGEGEDAAVADTAATKSEAVQDASFGPVDGVSVVEKGSIAEEAASASVSLPGEEGVGDTTEQSPEVPAVQPTDQHEASRAASEYSRENASYSHRSGWRSLGTGKKVALTLILVLAILVGIAGGVGFALFKNAQDQLAVDDGIKESLTPVQADIDPYWMLVLGSDSRAEDTDRARSDVLMLVRIDPQAPKVTMVSIPRDTRVTIEGYGTQKINAAYALGGAELAIKTVESYAGVKISHYAEIYFSGLEDLVNQLGGVTVDVPEHCKYSDVELFPGVQTLTGHEALIFARCRKTYSEGDFTRTKCQRILLEALVGKVLEKPVTELPEVVASTAKCFSTDIPLADLVTLAQKMQSSGDAKFYSAMAPSTTGMVGGVSYTFTYINQWKLLMQRAANGEDPAITEEEAKILGLESTSYSDMDMTTSIPEETMAELQKYWDEKAAKEAEEQQKAKEKSSKSSESSADNKADSNAQNKDGE